MEKIYEKLPEGAFGLLMSALDIKEPKCKFCGVVVTEKNYGIIAAGCIACNNFDCKMEGILGFENASVLPIVKYEGTLWFFDERCNELRDYYTAEPRRLDSSGIDKEYFRDLVIKAQTSLIVYDADRTDDDEKHVPHTIRNLLPQNIFDKDNQTGDTGMSE